MADDQITVQFRQIGRRVFGPYVEGPTFPCERSVTLNIYTPNGKLQITVSTDGKANPHDPLRTRDRD